MVDRMSRPLATGALPYAAQTRFPVEACDILVTIAGVEPQAEAEKRGQKCQKKRSGFSAQLLSRRAMAWPAFAQQGRKNRDAGGQVWLFAGVKKSTFLLALLLALLLPGCQTAQSPTGGPGFEQDPTDSGSRYSQFNLPGSRMGMQNTDLDD